MSTRGRLIHPFKAKIYRLDVTATAADPDAGGPRTAGYDRTFREPKRIVSATNTNSRKELAPVLLPCQFEGDEQQGALKQTSAGDDGGTTIRLILHFQDLEAMGLVDPTSGEALIRKGDRFESMHDYTSEELIQFVGGASLGEGGLYCVEARPVSWGLSGMRRNLLIAVFNDRDASFGGAA